MTGVYDKNNVVTVLERVSLVLREVKGLPDFVKRGMALNAGCLVTDLDELEGLVDQAAEHVGEMKDVDECYDLDINANDDHFKAVLDAMDSVGSINDRDQIRIIKAAMESSDCFDSNIEGLNAMFRAIDKPWFVIDTQSRERMLEVCKDLTTMLEDE